MKYKKNQAKEDKILIPIDLLTDLLDDVIECYNEELNKTDKSLRHKNVLKEYKRKVDDINKLLTTDAVCGGIAL